MKRAKMNGMRYRAVCALLIVSMLLLLLGGCGQAADHADKPEDLQAEETVQAEAGETAKEAARAQKAAMIIIKAELWEEIEAGRLLDFQDVETAPGESAEYGQPVVVSYTLIFGDRKAAGGYRAKIACTLEMQRKLDGTYVENRKKREYEFVQGDENDPRSWIMRHPYVAWVAKEDVAGKSKKEIALQLFCQWMDTLKDWRTSDRTFVVTKYADPEIPFFLSTDEAEWGTVDERGYYGRKPEYPGSLHSWMLGCICRYQFLGYNEGLCSKAYGVEPFWVEDFAPGGHNDFILTEWEKCYTLETQIHCYDAIGGRLAEEAW